jgi:hypothetical protein
MKGFTFLKNQGLSIFFDPSTYDGLEDPFVSINTDWDAIAVQPEIILHQPGYLDAVALKDAPSDLAVFSVSVTWRGVGVPGPQPFAIYGTDFLTLASGQSQVVPEPGCLAYLGLGLLVLYRLPALGKKHPTQIAL